MSGYGEAVISRHGILDEGIELLQKPFAATELVSRVRELLDARADAPGAGGGGAAS